MLDRALISVFYFNMERNKIIFIVALFLAFSSFGILWAARIPSDPKWDTWDENNPQGNNWGQEFIKLPSAWDLTIGSKNTKIAVIERGADINHIDLSPNISSLSSVFLKTEHGTHVAGIIGAKGNNNIGLSGVDWDSDLMVLGADLSHTDIPNLVLPAILGIKKIIDNNAQALNLSIGLTNNNPGIINELNGIWKVILKYAISNQKNILYIISAGNDYKDFDTTSPASLSKEYNNVISVAAIDESGNLANFPDWGSNYGDVTVAAPGVNIYSTLPDNQYGYKSGTSMAAPFVSGLAGLIWSRAEELGKKLTAAEVKQLITDGAKKGGKFATGPDGNKIYIINAYESLKLLEPEPEPPPPVSSAAWPTFGHDNTRAGQSEYNGPATSSIKWTYTASKEWWSPYIGIVPVIGKNNIIYIGNDTERKLYALEPGTDGKSAVVKWIFSDNGNPLGDHLSAPSLAGDGTIYIGGGSGKLFAVNPDGTLKWKYVADNQHWVGTPAVGSDGTIYFRTTYSLVDDKKDYLFAINPDGSLKWRYEMGLYSGISFVSIGPDGTIYSSTIYTDTFNESVYALNPDGTLKWRKYHRPYYAPTVGPDGTLYFRADYAGLEAINPDDGVVKWSKNIYPSRISVAKDGIIIADDSATSALYALNPDGSEKWKKSNIGRPSSNSSAAISAEGIIYVTTNQGLFALDIKDGSVKWKVSGIWGSSPAIGADGTLYVGTNFNIYAIGE